jgi:hypothetical protein
LFTNIDEVSGSALVDRLRALTTAWNDRNGDEDFPIQRIRALTEAGALSAFVKLGDEPAIAELRVALRLVGGADLSLGRVFEGLFRWRMALHCGAARRRRSATAALAQSSDRLRKGRRSHSTAALRGFGRFDAIGRAMGSARRTSCRNGPPRGDRARADDTRHRRGGSTPGHGGCRTSGRHGSVLRG